jgi:hypothetical protein
VTGTSRWQSGSEVENRGDEPIRIEEVQIEMSAPLTWQWCHCREQVTSLLTVSSEPVGKVMHLFPHGQQRH